MSIDLLLTLCVILLSVALTLIAHTSINYLQGENRKHKRLHEEVLDEAHEWEKRALQYASEISDLAVKLEDSEEERRRHRTVLENCEVSLNNSDRELKGLTENFDERVHEQVEREKESLLNQMNVKSAPESHGVQAIDTAQIIANSDDPVWSVVEECRDLMPLWELKNPGIAAAQSHHRYAQFATFVANLCDEHRNRDGVARAIELLEAPHA